MRLRWIGLVLPPLIGASCAKFPDSSADVGDTRILFSMTVSGQIRSDYVYIVAIRVSNDLNPTGTGPQPVVTYPSANGFVAGGATHFVRWDPLQSRSYTLYRFSDPSDGTTTDGLTSYVAVGIPITQTDVTEGSRKISFELSTRQLADTVATASALQSVRVNFLTMNRIALESGSGRVFDGLGDTRTVNEINTYFQFPINTSGTYSNARQAELEPTGDVQDPDLDISDWSVEVRRQ